MDRRSKQAQRNKNTSMSLTSRSHRRHRATHFRRRQRASLRRRRVLASHRRRGAHTNLAAAKARVASLKLVSISRLVLQAAVLGYKLTKTVSEECQIKANRRLFWTDSKTVLARP
ncbi:hypothetical protein EVAR_55723_1 [Eumeta japonica]|uniref:Uncharacterized protein n=1 Tax=Eumeta variegata TaxID=151549 RepID=A0A4C1Z3M5_EUMVA|nr:hypothetical protein EVAR_55723_1 [Eumeta japonica]